MIEHRRQTKGTNTCGQVCIAMVVGAHVDKVKKWCGKTGSTRSGDLRKALNHCGYEGSRTFRMTVKRMDHLLERNCTALTFVVMLRPIENTRSMGHWVVVNGKYVYDPRLNDKRRIRSYFNRELRDGWRATSYFVAEESVLFLPHDEWMRGP